MNGWRIPAWIAAVATVAAAMGPAGAQTLPRVAAGAYHSLAVMPDGTMRAWGFNNFGQLGLAQDNTTNALLPAQVTVGAGLPLVDIVETAAGGFHSLALKADGIVYAWGKNSSGQLGDNATAPRSVPFWNRIGPGSTVIAIAAGESHSMALKSSGEVLVWGDNSAGQVGDGTATDSLIPKSILATGSGVVAIAAGRSHSLALKAGGALLAWGLNGSGQLGDGTATNRFSPIQVLPAGSGVVAIAAGALHSLALKSDGTVLAWGGNSNGQLGDGTTSERRTPVIVAAPGSGIRALAAGESHSAALRNDGAVLAWGFNYFNQLGNGNSISSTTPLLAVDASQQVIGIAAGANHGLLLRLDGSLRAWGANDFGQSGTGNVVQQALPVQVIDAFFAGGVIEVAAGVNHALALRADGRVMAVGANLQGQLGNATNVASLSPVQAIGPGSGVVMVAAGDESSYALKSDGSLLAWGLNNNGQLGIGSFDGQTAPVQVLPPGSGVVAISADSYQACSLSTSGAVRCWGFNTHGELGNGTTTLSNIPVDVVGLSSGVISVRAGGNMGCVLMQDGTVSCWGWTVYNALGRGGSGLVPGLVVGLDARAMAVGVGDNHGCALLVTGIVQCWGRNSFGNLADGVGVDESAHGVQFAVGLPANTVSISIDSQYGCARAVGGIPRCWGRTSNGQLGNGGPATGAIGGTGIPVEVVGANGTEALLVAAGYHTFWGRVDGTVRGWGLDNEGQLGSGSVGTNQLVPIPSNLSLVRAGTFQVDDLNFPAKVNVSPGVEVTSDPFTVSNLTVPANVAVRGGQHSVGCTGTFQTGWTKIRQGQSLCVRATSATEPGGTRIVHVQVNGVVRPFVLTTGLSTPPSSPRQVLAAAGQASATVSFDPPISDGGSAILQYTVTASPGAATTLGAASPINFPGLAIGTSYTFTVAATNANGTSAPSSPSNPVIPFAPATARSSFNGDALSDVLWRDSSGGLNYQWQMNGLAITAQGYMPSVPSNWAPVATGDVNGDGRADVLWREAGGLTYLWTMNGLTVETQGYLPTVPAPWIVTGMGDVTGDGKADVFWRNPSTGQNYLWVLDSIAITSQGFFPSVGGTDWEMVGIADYSGDGKADVFWRNKATGDNYLWVLDGLALVNQGFLPIVPTDWEVVASPNANGNTTADAFWRNKVTGDNYLWLMNGLTVTSQGYLPAVGDVNWKVAGFGDYNGDGRGDILWRNPATGQVYLWTLNGLNVESQGFLPSVNGSNWGPVK